jgi:hypothetical protein
MVEAMKEKNNWAKEQCHHIKNMYEALEQAVKDERVCE